MYNQITRESKIPGNVITSLRAEHGPGKENALEGISEPRFFNKWVGKMINYPSGWFDTKQLPGGEDGRQRR